VILEVNTPQTLKPTSFAISPDGRYLAFVASEEGQQKLWLRALNQPKHNMMFHETASVS